MITHLATLLSDRPEQEQNLLRLLAAKLGDPDGAVASKTSHLLLELLHTHPAMKAVIVRDISAGILKPGAEPHARYYGVITLNQIVLFRGEHEVAAKLFDVYFDLFGDLLDLQSAVDATASQGSTGRSSTKRPLVGPATAAKKRLEPTTQADGEANSKMLAALLTGVHRAFPYTQFDANAYVVGTFLL